MSKKLTEKDSRAIAQLIERDEYDVAEIVPPAQWPARRRGRPSLSHTETKKGTRSPQVTVRVTPALRKRAERRAKREGKTMSEIAREALDAYV